MKGVNYGCGYGCTEYNMLEDMTRSFNLVTRGIKEELHTFDDVLYPRTEYPCTQHKLIYIYIYTMNGSLVLSTTQIHRLQDYPHDSFSFSQVSAAVGYRRDGAPSMRMTRRL